MYMGNVENGSKSMSYGELMNIFLEEMVKSNNDCSKMPTLEIRKVEEKKKND